MRCLALACLLLAILSATSCGAPTATRQAGPTAGKAAAVVPSASPSSAAPAPADTATVLAFRAAAEAAPTRAGTGSNSDLSGEAEAYLDAALDIMQQHAITRDQVEWPALRSRTYRRAYGARTAADTYRAIQYALVDLGDGHSFFMTPEQVAQMQDGSLNATVPEPSGRPVEAKIACVSLPAFAGQGEAAVAYATAVQQILRDLAAGSPCGWIVDLRENTGGSMWPMLAGIGPLLGEGLAGSFVAPDGTETAWYYRDGQALQGNEVQAAILGEAYEMDPLPPVAVLTGPSTSSSGEAIAVAFRGRPGARSFGQATQGLSTANQEFVLSDGAWLLLTVSRFADRAGQVYGSPVVPDQVISQRQGQDDATLQAAVAWMLGQPACGGSG
jgi:carboxyl-terminal processing protease